MREYLSYPGVPTQRHFLTGPIFVPSAEFKRKFTFDEWLDLNSFAARLFAAEIHVSNHAIFELRHSLEENENEMRPRPVADARVRIACEWIVLGGRRLL